MIMLKSIEKVSHQSGVQAWWFFMGIEFKFLYIHTGILSAKMSKNR
jgi:hypothetical protein